MLRKVISGGQTGIDQIGLQCARMVKLETGGTAPKNFRTENGSKYELRDIYGLKEHSDWRYGPRTECNVEDSDGTVLFGDMSSQGSVLTLSLLKKHNKPRIKNPTFFELKKFIDDNSIEVLNVAGNRGSKLTPFQRSHVGLLLLIVFKSIVGNKVQK